MKFGIPQGSRQWAGMMRRICFRVALLAASCCVLISPKPSITADFFPYTAGWLGADAAYSISINATTTLWLFGDTFVGQQRAARAMIHNSIAIRKCKANCELTYWWSGAHTGYSDAFFKTPETNYFWPLDGFMYDRRLYIFLEQMHSTGEGGAFGFDYSAVMLATVANPSDNPDRWVISYKTISEGNGVVPGIAAALPAEFGNAFAYAFTLFRRSAPQSFVGLMRCALADLSSKPDRVQWQYLTNNGHWLHWIPSTSPSNAGRAFDGNVSEMSVKYHRESHSWLAIFPTPEFFSSTASYAESHRLSGPWTAARSFFRYPEMARKKDGNDSSNVFCYAAKEHPELESGGNLAFTYACNSQNETQIFTDMRLYRPQLVRESLRGDVAKR